MKDRIREAIVGALPGAEVEVDSGGPGHFTIAVTSASFEGETRVRQQQRVYAAIAPLMSGANAPVHAVDKLVTRVA
jgi:acid stress-induced BolA-like protein IbaG/YrbA